VVPESLQFLSSATQYFHITSLTLYRIHRPTLFGRPLLHVSDNITSQLLLRSPADPYRALNVTLVLQFFSINMPILPQCQGFCRDKTQCNRTLKEGRRYCQTHSSQESYSLKRKCLYATIAAKKQKTWKDGLYHWNHVNKQVQLYDERGIKIDEIFGQEPERSECYQLTRFELEVQLDSDEEDSGDDHPELAAQDGAQEGDAQVLMSIIHLLQLLTTFCSSGRYYIELRVKVYFSPLQYISRCTRFSPEEEEGSLSSMFVEVVAH